MKARPLARAALPAALLCLLVACESLDRLAFGPEPTVETNPVVATPLPPGTAYPTVNMVPPRPQLSYPVEQERAIVEALISDREHANYTSQVTRYRTGRSDLPPPPGPPPPVPAAAAEAVVPTPAASPAQPAASDLLDPGEGSSSDDYARTQEPDQGVLDDGSLNDFVREFVNETETTPGLSTETAVIDRRAQDARTAKTRPGQRESNFPRLFSWIARQFFGADEAPPPAGPAPAAAATGVTTAADESAPPPVDAAPLPGQPKPAEDATGAPGDETSGAPAAEPDDRSGDQAPAQAPVLKPDESADPPEPAPEKPDQAARVPAGGGTVALLVPPRSPGHPGRIVRSPPTLSTGPGVT